MDASHNATPVARRDANGEWMLGSLVSDSRHFSLVRWPNGRTQFITQRSTLRRLIARGERLVAEGAEALS